MFTVAVMGLANEMDGLVAVPVFWMVVPSTVKDTTPAAICVHVVPLGLADVLTYNCPTSLRWYTLPVNAKNVGTPLPENMSSSTSAFTNRMGPYLSTA